MKQEKPIVDSLSIFIVVLTVGLILLKLTETLDISWWWIIGIFLLGRIVILSLILFLSFILVGTLLLLKEMFEKVFKRGEN